MRVAIMQPYFLPYIGYFQLIQNVDKFVLYDTVQYIKNGWINRNRLLLHGRPVYITLPVKRAASAALIQERELADTFVRERKRVLKTIKQAYQQAPEFKTVFPLLEEIMMNKEQNLSTFVTAALQKICWFLGINTAFVPSGSSAFSAVAGNAEERVIQYCNLLAATNYINLPGGKELYTATAFEQRGIQLEFLTMNSVSYSQFNYPFVPHLSIVDVLMFNTVETIQEKFLAK